MNRRGPWATRVLLLPLQTLLLLLQTGVVRAEAPVSFDLEDKEPLQCNTVRIGSRISTPLPPFTFCIPMAEGEAAAATSSAPISPFSFDTAKQVIERAISQDHLVISQQQLVESAAYALKSARGNWWPTVSMSNSSLLFTDIRASQNYSGSPFTPSSPATAGKAFNPFNGSSNIPNSLARSAPRLTPVQQSSSNYTQAYPVVTLQWNLINPGRYPQIAAARKQLELARSQEAQTILNRKDSLAQSIALYLLSGIKLGELRQLLTLQNQLFNDTSRRVSVGLDPRLNKAQQYRNLLNVQTQIVQAKTNQSNAAIQLEQSLAASLPALAKGDGTPETSINDLLASLPLDQFPVQDWPYSLEDTISRSLKASPNLAQLELQAGIAIDNANEQYAADLPIIGLLGYSTYQYTWGSQAYQPPTQPSGAFSRSLSNYFGLSITWNIFNGHIYRNQALSYQRQAKSIRSQYADARKQTIVTVRSLYRQLALLKQQISLSLADWQAASSIASDMQLRSQYKLNTTADMLQASIDVHQSRLQLIASIAQYLDVYAKLSVSTGVSALAVR